MSDPRLLHYSRTPVFDIYDVPQEGAVYGPKPNGLWLSVGNAWQDYVLDHMSSSDEWQDYDPDRNFKPSDIAHVYEVTLAPDAAIARLKSYEEVAQFTSRYMTEFGVDWQKAARDFDGILVTPYERDEFTSIEWYDALDVASACVWNASAIQKVSETHRDPPLIKLKIMETTYA